MSAAARMLLLGRSGQLGAALHAELARLGEIVSPTREQLDLASGERIRAVVRDLRPSLIVNAAALTSLDGAERDPELAMRINADAVAVLAEEAKAIGAALVHFSTDCVFDGEKTDGYVEQDAPAPISAYGRSKLAGEQAWLASECRGLLLRVAWLYAREGRSFYAAIRRAARTGEPVHAVEDRTGIPTPAGFVALQTGRLLAAGAEGLFHVAPRGVATWLEFARAVCDVEGLRVDIRAASSRDQPGVSLRPACSVLGNGKLERTLSYPLPDWRALLPTGG